MFHNFNEIDGSEEFHRREEGRRDECFLVPKGKRVVK